MIRNTKSTDTQAILNIVAESGQFDDEALQHVGQTLAQHLEHGDSSIWLTADDGEPVGVAYCAAEAVAAGTWNLQMLWTRADRHGKGHGTSLVQGIETEIRGRGARLLIVETSSLAAFAPARAFYAKCGFEQEATIKNFFATGDDKVVFTKSMLLNAV